MGTVVPTDDENPPIRQNYPATLNITGSFQFGWSQTRALSFYGIHPPRLFICILFQIVILYMIEHTCGCLVLYFIQRYVRVPQY